MVIKISVEFVFCARAPFSPPFFPIRHAAIMNNQKNEKKKLTSGAMNVERGITRGRGRRHFNRGSEGGDPSLPFPSLLRCDPMECRSSLPYSHKRVPLSPSISALHTTDGGHDDELI